MMPRLLLLLSILATAPLAIGAAPARIRVSEDGHYFVYKGKPTVLFGAGTARRKPVVSARTILNPSRGEASHGESRKEFWTTFVSGGHIGSYREIFKEGRLDTGQLSIIRHLRTFVDRVPFYRMEPVDDVASHRLAFVERGEHYVVYLPVSRCRQPD